LKQFCAKVVFLRQKNILSFAIRMTAYLVFSPPLNHFISILFRMEKESYRHKGLRKKLIDSIRDKGISDARVLEAMNRVPRHLFMDSSFLEFAYQDKAFPIGSGQTISQPYTVAVQTELLNVAPGMKVLEIGTGSGYQACILVELDAKVYTIERQKNLYEKTKAFLPTIGYSPKMFFGDGYKGLPAYAPFDRILITAAAPEVPHSLLDQLKPDGLLVAPVGPSDGIQIMRTFLKMHDGSLITADHGTFRFVPMLEKKGRD
jgi:protein-L-isoaspartate(D-aspartate) O-methyltransferase